MTPPWSWGSSSTSSGRSSGPAAWLRRPDMRQEVRLAGFGGQGIILAGYVLGKAAALYDGKNAILTQSYGPEARGGACSAELVISDEPIDYPLLSQPDFLVCMSQEAFSKYGAAAVE